MFIRFLNLSNIKRIRNIPKTSLIFLASQFLLEIRPWTFSQEDWKTGSLPRCKVKNCEDSVLYSVAIVMVTLTFMFSFFYGTGEICRLLHPRWAKMRARILVKLCSILQSLTAKLGNIDKASSFFWRFIETDARKRSSQKALLKVESKEICLLLLFDLQSLSELYGFQ